MKKLAIYYENIEKDYDKIKEYYILAMNLE